MSLFPNIFKNQSKGKGKEKEEPKSSFYYPPTSLDALLSNIPTHEITEQREFNKDHHKIVSLLGILEMDPVQTMLMDEQFQSKGWCIVDLGEHLIHDDKFLEQYRFFQKLYSLVPQFYVPPVFPPELINNIREFFEMDLATKQKYQSPDGEYGFNFVPHNKEGIHISTGEWGISKQFGNLEPSLTEMSRLLDILVCKIMENFFAKVLNMTPAKFAYDCDIPACYDNQVGLLDIVNYHNKITTPQSPPFGSNTSEVNTVPHFDPGLFSLSFFSSHEGLQLLDLKTNTWFAGPINVIPAQEALGVIWLGDNAVKISQGKWKPGVHRVVYPQVSRNRLTCWYEVCTVDQINNKKNTGYETTGFLSLKNIQSSLSLIVKKPDRKYTARKIERKFGIPFAKVLKPSDTFNPLKEKYEQEYALKAKQKEEKETKM